MHHHTPPPAAPLLLAGLTALPRHTLTAAVAGLEPADFTTPADRIIFDALTAIAADAPQLPNRAATVEQLHGHLLESGELTGTNGRSVRARIADLAGGIIDGGQVPRLAATARAQRFRAAVSSRAAELTERADTAPLADLDATLDAAITELRRLRARITNVGHLNALNGGAA